MVEYVEIRTYTTPARLPPLTPSPRKRVSPFAPQSIYQTLIQQHNWTLFFLSTFLFASLRYLVNSLCEETVFIRPEWADLIDSNPLLEYVRIRSRRLGYNLSLVEEFCTAETKLDNCQLDWERILVDVPKLMALKELTTTNSTYCFHRHTDAACFNKDNFTVRTQKLQLSSTTWQMEVTTESHYSPQMILAYSPLEFVLIMDTYSFCHLNLLDNECLHYDY